MKLKSIEVSQATFERLDSIRQPEENVDSAIARILSTQEDYVLVRLQRASEAALSRERIGSESLDGVVARLVKPASPVDVEKAFSPDMFLRFKTFANPGETPDETLGRLLKLVATNSIDEELKERVLKAGRGGEHLSDIIDNLHTFYMAATMRTSIRNYIQARKDFDNLQNRRDSRKYLGHKWDSRLKDPETKK